MENKIIITGKDLINQIPTSFSLLRLLAANILSAFCLELHHANLIFPQSLVPSGIHSVKNL